MSRNSHDAHLFSSATKNNPLSSNHHRRGTWSYSTSPTVIPTSPEKSAFASARCTPNHQHALNNFLSTLDDEYCLDCFGSAFLPMNFDGEAGKMLLVIEAPNNKETFRLYTHFNGNIERCKESTTPTANRVLGNLLRHGKHKSLTLANVCDERMRFSFEEKNSEISSEANVKNVLDMFVKVSFRMKKIIEAASPQSRNISSALVLPPARTNSASDSSTAAIAVPFEDCPESSLRQAQFALGCRSVSESGRSYLSTGKIASSSAGYSSVTERAGHLSPPPRTQDLSSCCAFYLK